MTLSIKGSAAVKLLTRSGRMMAFCLCGGMNRIYSCTEMGETKVGKRIYNRPVAAMQSVGSEALLAMPIFSIGIRIP